MLYPDSDMYIIMIVSLLLLEEVFSLWVHVCPDALVSIVRTQSTLYTPESNTMPHITHIDDDDHTSSHDDMLLQEMLPGWFHVCPDRLVSVEGPNVCFTYLGTTQCHLTHVHYRMTK